MDSSYSWHPGAVPVAPQWAVPVALLPDEIFSSWLMRTAMANGCDPLVLTGSLWPTYRLWAGDIDRRPAQEFLNIVSRLSGIDHQAIVKATLHPVALRISRVDPPERQAWPWILSASARNRRRIGQQQYCPVCLAEDVIPFFRIQWRFAWHCVCEAHGCLLVSHCPHCHASLEPHRLTAEKQRLDICSCCGESLARSRLPATHMEGAIFLQHETNHAVLLQGIQFIGMSLTVSDWFATMQMVLDLIRRALQGQTVAVERLIGGRAAELNNGVGVVALENLPFEQRASLLNLVGRMMCLSLDDLLVELNNAGLTRQAVFPRGWAVNDAWGVIARALPDRPKSAAKAGVEKHSPSRPGPKSQRQVERMMKVLRRRVLRGRS